jgi:hypothetical protein
VEYSQARQPIWEKRLAADTLFLRIVPHISYYDKGILDRYRQIQPRFIFSETEVQYGGKVVDLLPKVSEVVTDLTDKGLQKAILLPSTVTGEELTSLVINR